MAALLGTHIQQISFSEHVQLLHRNTMSWIEQLLPWRTRIEQLCWSTWSSNSLGANTAAPLEHNEQLLPQSTESSYAGACGAAAVWEQIQLLHSSTWSSGSLRADTGAPVEHYGAAASQEHTEQLASLEHREQLCWSSVEQRLSGSRYSSFTGEHGAAPLW